MVPNCLFAFRGLYEWHQLLLYVQTPIGFSNLQDIILTVNVCEPVISVKVKHLIYEHDY